MVRDATKFIYVDVPPLGEIQTTFIFKNSSLLSYNNESN